VTRAPAPPSPAFAADPPFVEIRRVTKSFGRQTVLDAVDLEIRTGELVAILGPSGCGKSTLLRILAGLERDHTGRVLIGGRDVTAVPPTGRGCGIVFQSYALFPNLTVASNIGFGIDRRIDRSARSRRVVELLDLIGLPDIAGKFPAQLSGGQQQRVALARALAVNPSLLLLDEPLSALDATVRVRLRGEIRQIQQRLGLTTILVTHDQDEALTMADRIVVMDHGRILQVGTPEQIYGSPRHRSVGQFVGGMNLLPGWERETEHRVRCGNAGMNHHSRAVPPGTNLDLGFRAEDARIVPDASGANTIPALIDRVEFRGAVRRIYLTCFDALPIAVDAPADHPPDIPGDRRVAILLRPECVRLFGPDGVAL
jgi:iron(III) transport system ATP-binding protein